MRWRDVSPPLFITFSLLAFFLSKGELENMCFSQLLGDHFSKSLRKLVWVVRSEWRGCVFRFLFFPSFPPSSQKVSFSVCFGL